MTGTGELWTTGEAITAEKLNKFSNTCMQSEIDDGTVLPVVMGDQALCWDTGVLYISSNGETWTGKIPTGSPNAGEPIFAIIRYTNIGTCLNGDTGLSKAINTSTTLGRSQDSPTLNDFVYLFFFAYGTETKLCITTVKDVDCGKWELYVGVYGDILDSATQYDDYAATPTVITRTITLVNPLVPGYNLVGLKIVDKNASTSSPYYKINVLGAMLQP